MFFPHSIQHLSVIILLQTLATFPFSFDFPFFPFCSSHISCCMFFSLLQGSMWTAPMGKPRKSETTAIMPLRGYGKWRATGAVLTVRVHVSECLKTSLTQMITLDKELIPLGSNHLMDHIISSLVTTKGPRWLIYSHK